MKTNAQLLKDYATIMDDLVDRGILRTGNNPISDYAEWLFAKAFHATLPPSSNSGFDAVDRRGIRYQVKSRRMGKKNLSTLLGVMRDAQQKKFDYLVVVFFNHDFTIRNAYIAPHSVVEKYGRFSKHQRGHVLNWRGDVTHEKSIKDITERIRAVC